MPSTTEQYDAIVTVWKSGQYDDAIAQMLKLHETSPTFALAAAALAAWNQKIGKPDDAIKYAEKYCELAPDDSFGFSILSSYYISVGLHNEAEDAQMKARNLRIAAQLKSHGDNE
ncbi:MAG: hypothetical protein LBU65_11580 [Planctomycetaceae bacterium]|jgi:tetratricopeptide (TPR) repeat protein|nr:hypothetical protein [Planctomycetaceae bacterium]